MFDAKERNSYILSKVSIFALKQELRLVSSSFRHIVRIVDADLKGEDKLVYALTKVRGIGINTSYAILRNAGIERKDPFTGNDLHLLGTDLVVGMKSDIDLMKKMKSWKGVRHAVGLKVRGQCTRTTGRFGAAVGVARKAVMQQQQAAAQATQEKK